MRCFYTFFIGLLLTVSAYSQIVTIPVTELIMPRYMQGINSTSATRVPFVCRLKLEGLPAGLTFRYIARFVSTISNSTTTGEGGFFSVNPTTGDYKRNNSPTVASTTTSGLLTTDAAGTYTGWFVIDAGTSNMFTPGGQVTIRVSLNDGATSGSSANQVKYQANTTSTINLINWGNTAADGTALRSTPAAGATAKNFVMLYDNTTAGGSDRPVTGTIIESDGYALSSSANNMYAPFYMSDVETIDKAWGTIIPNDLTGGIKKIVQYSQAGSEVASRVSSNGLWPTLGNTTVSTILATGGTTNVIVLDGNVVTLAPGAPVKLSQSISFNNLADVTYGDDPFAAGATATSGLAVTYTTSDPNVATIENGNMIRIVGAGTVNITADQTGDDNYNAAPSETRQLTVRKADLIIQANDQDWVMGTTMPVLTVKYTGFKYDDDENDLNPKPQVSTIATGTLLGNFPIKVENTGSPNYNIDEREGTIKVVDKRQPQTITFDPLADKTYGDADYNPGAISDRGLTVKLQSSNTAVARIVNDNIIDIVAPGTTIITATQAGNSTYEAATPVDQLLKVKKAPLRVIAENKTRLVGRDNPPLSIMYVAFVNGETENILITKPVISTTATRSSGAGDYVIKVEGATADNYEIEHVNGVLTIDPLAAQQISFDALPVMKYGGGDYKPVAKSSSTLAVSFTSSNPAVATIIGDAIHITGAGTTEIIATQAGNAVYAPADPVKRTLTVQKAVLNIKADNKTKYEGDNNPSFTVTYSGFVNNEDESALGTLPTITTTASAASLAGSYGIVPQDAASNNYKIQYQQGTLTILPSQGEGQDNVNAYMSSPGQLQVNVFVVKDVKTAIQLFDGNGTRLMNTTVSMKQGFNTYRLPTGNISPGIYNLRIAGNGLMLKTKVVIR